MPSPKKKQRRGDLTKRHLIDATKQLLAKYDYQSITLDQVSQAVGVAKSSILWHFGSKEGLLTEAVFDLFEEIDEKISLVKGDLATLSERVEYLLGTVGDYFEANPEAKGVVMTLLFNSRIPPEIHERIRKQWNQHLREIKDFLTGNDRTVSDDEAATIMALMHGVYLQWHLNGCPPGMRYQLLDAFQALAKIDSADVS